MTRWRRWPKKVRGEKEGAVRREGENPGREGEIQGGRGKSSGGGGKSKFRMKSTRIADPGLVFEIVSGGPDIADYICTIVHLPLLGECLQQ